MPRISRLTEQFGGNYGFETGSARAESWLRLGTEMRRMREEMGWTQAALAERAGVDQSDVSKLEAGIWGKRGIRFDTLNRVLPVFGLQVLHAISPLPGARLSRDVKARAAAMSALLQAAS